jgi:hypothetical protein
MPDMAKNNSIGAKIQPRYKWSERSFFMTAYVVQGFEADVSDFCKKIVKVCHGRVTTQPQGDWNLNRPAGFLINPERHPALDGTSGRHGFGLARERKSESIARGIMQTEIPNARLAKRGSGM